MEPMLWEIIIYTEPQRIGTSLGCCCLLKRRWAYHTSCEMVVGSQIQLINRKKYFLYYPFFPFFHGWHNLTWFYKHWFCLQDQKLFGVQITWEVRKGTVRKEFYPTKVCHASFLPPVLSWWIVISPSWKLSILSETSFFFPHSLTDVVCERAGIKPKLFLRN